MLLLFNSLVRIINSSLLRGSISVRRRGVSCPIIPNTIQTDNGHEFQSKFHWHVQDLGMRHRFIKAGTPPLNGKVERSHLTDKKEFYQLLTYTDDVNLNEKLQEWEQFYNFNRPHGSFKGKTPYEVLKCKLNI